MQKSNFNDDFWFWDTQLPIGWEPMAYKTKFTQTVQDRSSSTYRVLSSICLLLFSEHRLMGSRTINVPIHQIISITKYVSFTKNAIERHLGLVNRGKFDPINRLIPLSVIPLSVIPLSGAYWNYVNVIKLYRSQNDYMSQRQLN
jgi:hypothetical protein